MTKEALQSLGKEAAESFLSDDTRLNDAVRKIASDQSLTDEQIERVAHYANRSVNAELMKESAYTDFETAKAGQIIDAKKTEEKTAAFAPQPTDSQEKTASEEPSPVIESGLFGKIASVYGVDYVPSPSPKRDAKHLLDAAEKVACHASDQLEGRVLKLAEKAEEVYEEVKNSIYEGASPKEALQAMKDEGHDNDTIEHILTRLEADGMIPRSEYSDSGPYSLERKYLKEGGVTKIAEDAPLRKRASEYKTVGDNTSFDGVALQIAAKVAENAEELSGADFDSHPGLAEKQAGVFSSIGSAVKSTAKGLGEFGKNTFETAEDIGEGVGKWVWDKPGTRAPAVLGGGYFGGQFLGEQKNDATKQKRQFP